MWLLLYNPEIIKTTAPIDTIEPHGAIINHRLVLDKNIHKGTSKRHKTDTKAPILRCTLLHHYLIFLNWPTTPNTHSKI